MSPVAVVQYGSINICSYLSHTVNPTIALVGTPQAPLTEYEDSFTLDCSTNEGFPSLPLTWLRNNQPVIQNDRIMIDSTQARGLNGLYTVRSMLRITNVTTVDAGQYVCRRNIVPPLPPQSVTATIMVQG